MYFLLNSCNNFNNQVTINGTTMGTTYSIKIDNLTHDNFIIKTKIDSLLKNINYHFSTYDIQSEISSINSSYLIQNKISKTFSL